MLEERGGLFAVSKGDKPRWGQTMLSKNRNQVGLSRPLRDRCWGFSFVDEHAFAARSWSDLTALAGGDCSKFPALGVSSCACFAL